MQLSVVVTGAGSGIGRAVSHLFAKKGYRVILLGRNASKLEETARMENGTYEILSCDMGNSTSVAQTIAKLTGNPLEILVNNAGIFKENSAKDANAAIWKETFETNLMGPVQLTEGLISALKRGHHPSIINVSSTLGIKPVAKTSAYSASKAAMINWTQSLALELAPKIRVNCVCPGVVDTPIHSFFTLPAEQKAETLKTWNVGHPLGRIGKAEEIAEAILFLAEKTSAWTTGSILSVDGGIGIK